MSVINPKKQEYETPDALKIAQDVSWVIRTLWAGAVVIVLGAWWAATLAADVAHNTDRLDTTATKEQMETVIELLKSVDAKVDAGDDRQRAMKTQLDKLETKVDAIEKRDEN